MAAVGSLILGLILAFPFTWAVWGIYCGLFQGGDIDESAVSQTDVRIVIILVLLTMNLFRDRRQPMRPLPQRRSR